MEYLLILPLIWLFICVSGIAPLILLRFSNFSPVASPVPIFEKAISVINPTWIDANGFQGKSAIEPMGIPMAIFTNFDETVALAVYFAANQRIVDLVSQFPGEISLTTSTTIDGPLLPSPPGILYQGFPGYDVKDLLRIHQDGVDLLKQHLKTEPLPYGDVADGMRQFTARHLSYLMFRPWKILTLPYRYAVIRKARQELTLQQQEQKGIIHWESLAGQADGWP
ncbi:hypothetical protein AB1K70_21935 [Bremerella sp. JC770]|uniref:hypothetical protein n=1 Tax=Bremerella sp. JC770 TaxID=3232137 RepID=UPI0034585CBA